MIAKLGARDAIAAFGLCVLACGLWMAWRPLAPIAVGLALLALAIAPWRKA